MSDRSEKTTFRDALNTAAFVPMSRRGDAILAMPEMQAIRSTLLWVIECFGCGNDELPDSVYEWACGADDE